MRGIASTSPNNPEFARVVTVASLRRVPEFAFDLAPEPAEAEAVARLLGARSIRKMRFAGALRAEGEGVALDGRLGATVVQTCVVTLEPVTTRIDQPVTRRYRPEGEPAAEIEIGSDDDEIDPLGDRIDLGLVAIEALTLALPDYPRRPDATLDPAGDDPEPEAEADGRTRPFAALAGLRDKLPRRD